MKDKLAEFSLKIGRNEFMTETGPMRVYISTSDNGWMKRHHCVSMSSLQSSSNWSVRLADNWYGFDELFASASMRNKTMSLSTPPGLSLIFNELDVDFHGSFKRNKATDAATSRYDPALLKFFRTASGNLKAGTPELILKLILDRFRNHYNSVRFVEGMKRIGAKVGYSAPLDGSLDELYLEHAFGYKVSKPPNAGSTLPMGIGGASGINPFEASLQDVVRAKMKTGRKRHISGMTCFTASYVHGMKEKMRKVDTYVSFQDPRVRFRERIRVTANRLALLARRKYNVPSGIGVDDLQHKDAATILEFIRTSNVLFDLDPDKEDTPLARERKKNKFQYALDSTTQDIEDNLITDAVLRSELHRVANIEIIEHKAMEDAVRADVARNKKTVAEMKTALRKAGLSASGRKDDLLARIIENGVQFDETMEDGNVDPEVISKATNAWEKLRKKQLINRLMHMNADTEGNKVTLARRIAVLKGGQPPSDVYEEYKFEAFGGTLRSRIKAAFAGDQLTVTDFKSALWSLGIAMRTLCDGRVFGGYVRDLVIRGVYHYDADIDTYVSSEVDMAEVKHEIIQWCSRNDCRFKTFRYTHPSKSMTCMTIATPDDEDLEVQLIKEERLAVIDPLPDFDVNCLEICSDGKLKVTERHAINAGVNLRNAIRNLCKMPPVARQLKKVDEISNESRQTKMQARIAKMIKRGYQLLIEDDDS